MNRVFWTVRDFYYIYNLSYCRFLLHFPEVCYFLNCFACSMEVTQLLTWIDYFWLSNTKRKQDYAFCKCGGKERGNRLDYLLCFLYKGNIFIQGKQKKRGGENDTEKKGVVKAFLYCGTFVKIAKSWEMGKDTLGNAERLSALKADIVG